jgi:hypothetical protein
MGSGGNGMTSDGVLLFWERDDMMEACERLLGIVDGGGDIGVFTCNVVETAFICG